MDENYRIGIDLDALKMSVENSLARGFIKSMMPADAQESKDILLGVLTIFEKHNIGAVECLNIMRELSVFLTQHPPKGDCND